MLEETFVEASVCLKVHIVGVSISKNQWNLYSALDTVALPA